MLDDNQSWRELDPDAYAAAWQSNNNDLLYINDRYQDNPRGQPQIEDYDEARYEIMYQWRFAPEPQVVEDAEFDDLDAAYDYVQGLMDGEETV